MKDQRSNSIDELSEFKRFLGPAANEYSNAQLRQLRYEMHAMADLLLDIYSWKKGQKGQASPPKSHSSKKPPAFDSAKHGS